MVVHYCSPGCQWDVLEKLHDLSYPSMMLPEVQSVPQLSPVEHEYLNSTCKLKSIFMNKSDDANINQMMQTTKTMMITFSFFSGLVLL